MDDGMGKRRSGWSYHANVLLQEEKDLMGCWDGEEMFRFSHAAVLLYASTFFSTPACGGRTAGWRALRARCFVSSKTARKGRAPVRIRVRVRVRVHVRVRVREDEDAVKNVHVS